MNVSELLIISLGIFIIGFILGWLLCYLINSKPIMSLFTSLIESLKIANEDNIKLLKKNKKTDKPKLNVSFKPMTNDEFIKFFIKNNDEESKHKDFDERKFLIEELTRMKAKGWSPDDTLDELRNLYNLLD